jgi:hypothetical protein
MFTSQLQDQSGRVCYVSTPYKLVVFIDPSVQYRQRILFPLLRHSVQREGVGTKCVIGHGFASP